MKTQRDIERYFRVINNSLFRTTGNLDYPRVTDAIIRLSNVVSEYDGDTECIWYIGEDTECCLADLIVGAYWHYTDWHGGQWSQGYAALCALGEVFSPNMESLNTDSPEYEAYQALESIAS